MAMSSAYLNAIASAGAALVTHFGLVDETGTELSGGSYARIANTPTASGAGWAPSADLTFNVPAGIVGGWRAYSASTGGTDYGGQDVTEETFAAAGEYTLTAAETGTTHAAS